MSQVQNAPRFDWSGEGRRFSYLIHPDVLVRQRMLVEIVLLVPAIWMLVFFWWTRKYDYWEKRRIPHLKPRFPYGNVKDLINRQETFGQFSKKLYDQFPDAALVGFYGFQEPMLVVRDPELIKNVLIKDFNSFGIAGFNFYSSVEPIMALNPFGLSGDKWKVSRGFLSQALSLTKLKSMLPSIVKSSNQFTNHIAKQSQNEINIRELCRYFTIDSVASCAYSAECNSFEDPNNSFASETADNIFSNHLATLSSYFGPWLTLITRSRFLSKKIERFFTRLGPSLMQHREKNQITQNDLVQIIMAHNAKNISEGKKPLDNLETAATLAAFFLDGTDTVTLVMTLVIRQIANHQTVQDKIREEINKTGSTIEDFDIDKINSMEYLDMVVSETIRTHPIFSIFARKCTSETQLGGCTIEKGTKLIISVTGLNSDPKYFPEPHKFIPERFSKEGRERVPKSVFLPFGEGPKMCVGQKFANLEIKIGIVNLVKNFKITLQPSRSCSENVIPDHSESLLIFCPKEEIYVKFEPL